MLSIMVSGIAPASSPAGSSCCARRCGIAGRPVAAGTLCLTASLPRYPTSRPGLPVREFFCYQYTGEYGILDNYAPYRVFIKGERPGGGVNYCATPAQQATAANNRP